MAGSQAGTLGPVALLIQAEIMVSDFSILHKVDWHHVVFEGAKQVSPAAVAAAAKCVRKWGPTFISDGMDCYSQSTGLKIASARRDS